ncbi:MAG TPA: hypothetical protein VMW19_08515 [Myxococcota bacterium]|nr:hypothetical protein [Myxococcota bacterium]
MKRVDSVHEPFAPRARLAVLLLAAGLALGAGPSICSTPTANSVDPAPPVPEPVLGLSANQAASVTLLQGSPLLLEVDLAHPDESDPSADASPIVIPAAPASWAQNVSIEVTTDTGDVVAWPIDSPPAPAGDLRLDASTQGTLFSSISPSSSAGLATGDYVLTARLDTQSATAAGAFVGVVEAVPVAVHLIARPAQLAPADEIRDLESLARYDAFTGDLAAARTTAENLSLLHPESPQGFALLADFDAAAGDISQALADIEQALSAFYAKSSDSDEPPAQLLSQRRRLRNELLSTAQGGGAPSISARTGGKGAGATQDVVYVDLQLTNGGNATAVSTVLESVSPRVLAGSGSVSLESTLSPALPLSLPWLEPGQTTTVRLYFTAPSSVQRFAVSESGTTQGALGGDFHFSLSQAVLR